MGIEDSLYDAIDSVKNTANEVAQPPEWFNEFMMEIESNNGAEEARRLAEHYIGKEGYNEGEAIHVLEQNDTTLMTRYLAKFQEGEIKSEMVKKFNERAEEIFLPWQKPSGYDKTEYEKAYTLYSEINGLKPFGALAKYTDEVINKGRYTEENSEAPLYLAGLSIEKQQNAYELNPVAYARTFPASRVVEGETLQTIVNETIRTIETDTIKNIVNFCNIGRMRENVLFNPNLTEAQSDSIFTTVANRTFKIGARNESEMNQLLDVMLVASFHSDELKGILAQIVVKYYRPGSYNRVLDENICFKLQDSLKGFMSDEELAHLETYSTPNLLS